MLRLGAPTLFLLAILGSVALAAEPPRATTAIPVKLKSFDKAKPKELKVEYENKSGKEISHIRGGLSFVDKAGTVLHTTGVTEDTGKWAADAKSERQPFLFFNVPADLVKAMEVDQKSVKIEFKASLIKHPDGTEEKF